MSGQCCNVLTVTIVISWPHLIHNFYVEIFIEKKVKS